MKKSTSGSSYLLGKSGILSYENAYYFKVYNTGVPEASFEHHHDCYEISFYLGKNTGLYLIDQTEYTINQGDIILLDLFVTHMFKSERNEDHERFNIVLDPSLLIYYSTKNENLMQIFYNISHYPIVHLNAWSFHKYLDIIKRLLTIDMTNGYEMGERALVYQLLAQLYADTYDNRIRNTTESKRVELLTSLIKYIEAHLDENITLEDLAEMTNYSVTHISRIFKEETGMTLINYILDKRIEKATYILAGTLPISEVARSTGFNSYSHFYRMFTKKNGKGPEKWRRELRQNSEKSVK